LDKFKIWSLPFKVDDHNDKKQRQKAEQLFHFFSQFFLLLSCGITLFTTSTMAATLLCITNESPVGNQILTDYLDL
jgi:hypothetical protein